MFEESKFQLRILTGPTHVLSLVGMSFANVLHAICIFFVFQTYCCYVFNIQKGGEGGGEYAYCRNARFLHSLLQSLLSAAEMLKNYNTNKQSLLH